MTDRPIPGDMSPVEYRDGIWLKREDLYVYPNGVNGSKLRACEFLLGNAITQKGFTSVVSASSVLSPQSAIAASIAEWMGVPIIVVVGGTTVEKALNHSAIRIADEAGAFFKAIGVGYNPALQATAKKLAEESGAYHLQYGITLPPDASETEISGFHSVVAQQTRNLPPEVKRLVLPFGSGNTGAGVLLGLAQNPNAVEEVHLMCIGPDRRAWLDARLELLGYPRFMLPFDIIEHELHPKFATYGDRMPATLGGVEMHPTYEGKVVRYLDMLGPDWWAIPRGDTALWVVGGPLPRKKGAWS